MITQPANEQSTSMHHHSHGTGQAGAALLTLLLLIGQTPDALAKAQEDPETALSGTVAFSLGGVADATVGDGDAGYALLGGKIEVEAGPVIGAAKLLDFTWSHPEGFVEDTGGRNPWDTLNEIILGIKHGGRLSERMMYEVTAGVATGFEDQMADSFAAFVGAYGIYGFNETWAVMLGAFYSRHQVIETAFDFIPIIGVSFNAQATDGLSFTLGLPSTDVTWHFNETTRLTLDLSSLEGGVFRLADDSPVREAGYVELVSATASLRLETQIRGGLELGLGVGHAFDREMTLYDHDDGNERSYETEKKPGFLVSLSQSF